MARCPTPYPDPDDQPQTSMIERGLIAAMIALAIWVGLNVLYAGCGASL